MEFTCPKCSATVPYEEDQAGKELTCPACSETVTAPEAATDPAAEPTPAATPAAKDEPAVEPTPDTAPESAEEPAAETPDTSAETTGDAPPPPAPPQHHAAPEPESGGLKKFLTILAVVILGVFFFRSCGGWTKEALLPAAQAPNTSTGIVALEKPGKIINDMVDALEDMADDNEDVKAAMDMISAQSKEALGFDITNEKECKKAGLDLSAPITLAVAELEKRSGEPAGAVIGIGIRKESAALDTVKTIADKLGLDVDEEDGMHLLTPKRYSKEPIAAFTMQRGRLYLAIGRKDQDAQLKSFLETKSKGSMRKNKTFRKAVDYLEPGEFSGFISFENILGTLKKTVSGEDEVAAVEWLQENLSALAFSVTDGRETAYLLLQDDAPIRRYLKPGGSSRGFLKQMDKPVLAITASLDDPVGMVREVAKEIGGRSLIKALEGPLEEEFDIDLDVLAEQLKDTAAGVAIYPKDGSKGLDWLDEPDIIGFVRLQKEKKAKEILNKTLGKTDAFKEKTYDDNILYVAKHGHGPSMAIGIIDDYLVAGTAVDRMKTLADGKSEGWRPRIGKGELLGIELLAEDLIKGVKATMGDDAKVLDEFVRKKDYYMATLEAKGDGLLLTSESSLDKSGSTVGLMSALAMPSFLKARTVSQKNHCINNLRQIDSGKEQWALEKSKRDGEAVNKKEVNEYIKGNATPVCPQGGTYSYKNIGEEPSCSEHGELNY